MRRTCQHRWDGTTSTMYTPPPDGVTAERVSTKTMQLLAFGVTQLTQRCTKCGWREITQHLGKISL